MENLSHEHVGCAVPDPYVDPDVDPTREGEAGAGAVAVTRSRPAAVSVSLADLPADAPPPALWSKLEAQLRREGIITS